jgi:glycosyltransferase involved in cell wall biosynthesis
MKILLANATAYPRIGGVENSLLYIGCELLLAGHEVKVFCLKFSPDEPLQMEHDGLEIIRRPCTADRWPHMQSLSRVDVVQQAIPAILDEYRPDAIWCRSTPVGVGIRRSGYAGPLLQIFPTNAKMHCRGSFLQTRGLPLGRRLMLLGLWPSAYFASARLERELSLQCQAVVFSENMRRQLLAGFPENARACHVIHPGVDSRIFSPENGVRLLAAIEQKYGLNRNDPVVLYVGRLSNAKHIPLLMDALSVLQKDTKLVLVGSGPEEPRLKRYARRLGIARQCIFAGVQHEMLPGFYAISRVCVLPTTTESFGQVYLESLASGTPAVGFAGDGRRILTATDEIIQDGKTGGVVKKINARALAEKIDSILSLDPGAYALMARRARDDVRERFSWRSFVAEALLLSTRTRPVA